MLGIIALVEPADQPPASAAVMRGRDDLAEPRPRRPTEAIALHEQIRRFRQEAAAPISGRRLIGQGPEMQLARRQVELAAASRSSVLLVGPPGSGRQHLAAAIHYRSENRPDSPPLLRPIADAAGLLAAGRRSVGRRADAPWPGQTCWASRPRRARCLLHRVDELSADVQVELAGFLRGGRRPSG